MSGQRILLIDELPDDRELYKRGLAMLGYAVATVTAAEAREAAHSPPPDVIVLHIAGGKHWGVCDELRELYGPIPVVVVTAAVRPDEANRQRARATVNCAAFVGKPCTHLELGAVIARVLDGQRGIELTTGAGSEPAGPLSISS